MCVSTGSADHCVVSVPGESNSCTRKHVSELLALTKQDVKSCFLKSCLYVLVRRLPGEEHSAVQLNGKSVSIAGATHVFWVDPLCAPSPTFHFAFWSYQETLITLIIQRDILIFLFSSAPAIKTDLFPLCGFLNQPLSVTLAAVVMFMQSAKWKYTQVLTVWGKLLIKHRHFPQTVKTVVLSQGY